MTKPKQHCDSPSFGGTLRRRPLLTGHMLRVLSQCHIL